MINDDRLMIISKKSEVAVDPAQALKDFEPKHEFFVRVDSDGCAFDTRRSTNSSTANTQVNTTRK
ncbi:MAG: hypothetical protein JSW47_00285 [Phycisphaerales bacterium]|nr:MAG: hypothetical protein JSW47_00285 [Phycisphaerales bacterium]